MMFISHILKTYILKTNILKTYILKINLLKTNILIASLLLISCSHQKSICQSNWKVTGFYTPVASDFDTRLNKIIQIKRFKNLTFNKDFVAAVKLEGWGKTRFGWYLGYYGGQWHKENAPLNSLGYPLEIGAVAVDRKIVATGTNIFIPTVGELLNINQFRAVDIGSGIKKKHIDIYTGEGEAARNLSYQLTGNQQICFASQTAAPVVDLSAD